MQGKISEPCSQDHSRWRRSPVAEIPSRSLMTTRRIECNMLYHLFKTSQGRWKNSTFIRWRLFSAQGLCARPSDRHWDVLADWIARGQRADEGAEVSFVKRYQLKPTIIYLRKHQTANLVTLRVVLSHSRDSGSLHLDQILMIPMSDAKSKEEWRFPCSNRPCNMTYSWKDDLFAWE